MITISKIAIIFSVETVCTHIISSRTYFSLVIRFVKMILCTVHSVLSVSSWIFFIVSIQQTNIQSINKLKQEMTVIFFISSFFFLNFFCLIIYVPVSLIMCVCFFFFWTLRIRKKRTFLIRNHFYAVYQCK